MNLAEGLLATWSLVGAVAVKVILVVGIAELIQKRVASAIWRRTVWQVCILSILGLILLDFAGLPSFFRDRGQRTSDRLQRESVRSDSLHPNTTAGATESNAELTAAFRRGVAARWQKNRLELGVPSLRRADGPRELNPSEGVRLIPAGQAGTLLQAVGGEPATDTALLLLKIPSFFWPAFVWLVGTVVVALGFLMGRLFYRLVSLKRREISEPCLHGRVQELAARLHLRGSIRLLEIERLKAPIAFGVLRPAIGLPRNFTRDFRVEEQETMFAHELGHLASHDSEWRFLSELLATLLWWHPIVWWVRSRWQSAAEAAADETSLLLEDGPRTLAGCLVRLGGQLSKDRRLGWTGVAGTGFQSGLARRVECLVGLRRHSWRPPKLWHRLLVILIGPVGLASAVAVSTALAGPETFRKGETMKALQDTWKHTLIALALITSSAAESPFALAQQSVPAAGETSGQPVPSAEETPAAPPQKPESNSIIFKMDPKLLERYGLIRPGMASTSAAAAATQAAPKSSKSSVARPAEQRMKIESKLEQIVLAEVLYDSIPLSEVVKDLYDLSRKLDPDRRGVNFLLGRNLDSGTTQPRIDPVTGQAIPQLLLDLAELNNVVIRIHPALRNVRLKDVLNALTRVADRPISYTIEEYGVVFSPDPARAQDYGIAVPSVLSQPLPLQVRTFRVDTNNFLAGLERAFGLKVGTPPGGLAGATTNPIADRAPHPREVQNLLRQLLVQLGINMEVPNKSIFYNDLTGILMVRGSFEDMEVVQAAIETLGGSAFGDPNRVSMSGIGGLGSDLLDRYGMSPHPSPSGPAANPPALGNPPGSSEPRKP
ncbi:MAG: M56 family metallopeptidase [Verrucomicrobia bacterium]|nr:M56 family metallopeptidase [Verrucomicrobiota bacterium]